MAVAATPAVRGGADGGRRDRGQRRLDRAANAGRPAGSAGRVGLPHGHAARAARRSLPARNSSPTRRSPITSAARRRATMAGRRTIRAAIRRFTRRGGWTTDAAWSGRGARRSSSNRPMDGFHALTADAQKRAADRRRGQPRTRASRFARGPDALGAVHHPRPPGRDAARGLQQQRPVRADAGLRRDRVGDDPRRADRADRRPAARARRDPLVARRFARPLGRQHASSSRRRTSRRRRISAAPARTSASPNASRESIATRSSTGSRSTIRARGRGRGR